MPAALATPIPYASPDPVAIPDLAARAVAVMLSGVSDLSDLPIATAKATTAYARPILVVGYENADEKIYPAGIFQVTVSATLQTTEKTTAATLTRWDGALWNALHNTDGTTAAAIAAAQPGLQVHGILNPRTQSVKFSDRQLDTSYQVDLVAQKTAASAIENPILLPA
jgi:hypothetical protein